MTSLRIPNNSADLSTLTLPSSLTHLVIQGRTTAAATVSGKPAGGGGGDAYANALPRPGLVHKVGNLVHFLTDTPHLHERVLDDEYQPGLDQLLPKCNTLDKLELLALVDCQITENKDIDALELDRLSSLTTLVLLGVNEYNLGPQALKLRETLKNAVPEFHIIDDYASDLHRAASTMHSDAAEAHEALWCPTNPDICRIAMRGDPDLYKRYTLQPCVPPSAYLTPYQLAQLGNVDYTPWDVSRTVLAGAVAYLGAKVVLRSLTKWVFPSLRLPKFALLFTGAAVAYSTVGHEKLADALRLAAGVNLGWGVLLETATKALWAAGDVATGALLLLGIKVGMAGDDDAATLGDNDDGGEHDADTAPASAVPSEARAGFEALRVAVIKLMQQGAYKHIRDPDTVRTLLKLSVVKKRLRRPHVLLSVVVWVLKVCVLMGVGYGVYKVVKNEKVQAGVSKLSKELAKQAAAAYTQLKTHVKYVEHVDTVYDTVWKSLGFKRRTYAYEGEGRSGAGGGDGARAALTPSPYCPPLRSKADVLHPTHVCLDLVGRELWVVDRARVGESDRDTMLRIDSVDAGEETVHYASVRMKGSDKDAPITCTREIYEYCERVYKPSKTGDGDAGAAASASNRLQLPMKRVRVVKYKPHLSALESRVQGLLNIFLFRSQFLKSKLDAQEVVHKITKTDDSSSLDYDKLHDQFSPTLLSYFEQLAKNVLNQCPFEFNSVIDRFGKYAHNQLPANVQALLSHIGKQAKRYPILFAGLLLLMLLTLSGVLPLLLLVVSASLLSAGGLMLVSPELKQFLDPKQWKSTLRMLVRSFYQGNTTVVVRDTGDDGEKAAGGELYEQMKHYAAQAKHRVKQYATGAEKTVKQHLAGLSDGERKCDLSMEPVILRSPSVASGAPVSTSSVPTLSDDAAQCVYISCDLERPKHIQTVDEYTRPGLREARFLAKGLYFVAPDGKLFAFVKPAKQDENNVSPFRALIHVSDLCKFCRYPANDNKNQLIGEEAIGTKEYDDYLKEIHCEISYERRSSDGVIRNCQCEGTFEYSDNVPDVDSKIVIYAPVKKLFTLVVSKHTSEHEWTIYNLTIGDDKPRGGGTPFRSKTCIATQINGCWWFGHCKPSQPNTLYIDGTDDKLDIPTGSKRVDATTISAKRSDKSDLSTSTAAIIDVNEWNDSSQTTLARCTALKVLYVKGTPTPVNKMPAVPSCVRHLVVGSHSDRFGDDADGETRCKRWTAWLEAQTVDQLETLVLNTPVECAASARLNPEAVHVQFMDIGKPDDPWHGFCGTGTAETKQTTVHLRYIPALADDPSVLGALNTVAQSLRDGRIDIRETVCVQWCDASECHTTGNVPPSQRSTFLQQWREHSTGGVHQLYEALRRQFADRAALLQALSNRIPFGPQSKAFASKFKEACRPAFNLPPPAGEAPLYRLPSYFTAKYLSEKGCSIDTAQLTNSSNAQKMLKVDWPRHYPAHRPHILVAKDKSVWFYTPLQLNCVCVSEKRPSRAMVDLWENTWRGVSSFALTRDKATTQPIINITHDKLYAIEFDNIVLGPTSKVYAYSLTTQRCYPLRHTTVQDAKGQVVKNGAWGSLDGPHHDLLYPFEGLLKFLLQGVMGGRDTLHHLLGGKGYRDELMCFTVQPNGTLEWLTAKTDGRYELQPYGAGTFQHIVTGLHTVLQRLSESKTYATEMLQTKLRDNLVRVAMKHRGLLFKTYVKSLRDGTASHIQRFRAYVARVLQRLPKALGTLRNRLRRNKGTRKGSSAADTATTPTAGGTRKRPSHRRKCHPHRRRPPASTQRRRLAKRTRRHHRTTALSPALRSA